MDKTILSAVADVLKEERKHLIEKIGAADKELREVIQRRFDELIAADGAVDERLTARIAEVTSAFQESLEGLARSIEYNADAAVSSEDLQATLTKALDDARTAVLEDIETLKGQLDEISEFRADDGEAIGELQKAIDNLSFATPDQVADVESRIEAIFPLISEAKTAHLDGQVDLEKRIDSLRDRFAAVKELEELVASQKTEHDAFAKDTSNRIKSIDVKLSALLSDLKDELTDAVDEGEERHAAAIKQLDEIRGEVAALTEVEQRVADTLRTELKLVNETLTGELDGAFESLANDIKCLRSEIDEARDDDRRAIFEKVRAEVKDGVDGAPGPAGKDGEPGKDGRDGLDKITIAPRHITKGDKVGRNELIIFDGGLWQSVKKTTSTPSEQPAAYIPVVNGIASITGTLSRQLRQYEFTCTFSDGTQHVIGLPDMPRHISPDEECGFVEGDFWFEDECVNCYSGGEWHKFNIVGPEGKKGGRGRKGLPGRDGIGIEAVEFRDNTLILAMSDGEVKEFLIDIAVPEREEIDQEIIRYAGGWRSNRSYRRGDVVSAPRGLYLALRDTSEQVVNNEAWARMQGTEGGLFGGLTDNSPAAPFNVVANAGLVPAAGAGNGDTYFALAEQVMQVWDAANSKWVPSAASVIQAKDVAAIQALTGAPGLMARAQDTNVLYVYDGTWKQVTVFPIVDDEAARLAITTIAEGGYVLQKDTMELWTYVGGKWDRIHQSPVVVADSSELFAASSAAADPAARQGDLYYQADTGKLYVRNAVAAGGGLTNWDEVSGVGNPTTVDLLQAYLWQPVNPLPPNAPANTPVPTPSASWKDVRIYPDSVASLNDLSDRDVLPLGWLTRGKLVYVEATHQLYQYIADPGKNTDTFSDWKAFASGIQIARRVGNLPPTGTAGQVFLIQEDMAGQPLNRLVVWRDEPISVGSTIGGTFPVAAASSATIKVDLTGPTASEVSTIQITLTLGDGTVLNPLVTVQRGWGPAQIANEIQTKLGPLSMSITPTVSGDTVTIKPVGAATIASLTAAHTSSAGGSAWAYLNREVWNKDAKATPDQATDQHNGDFQNTLELGLREIKTYQDGAFHVLYSEEEVKEWIAAGSQFQGTVEETGGTTAAAEDIANMLPESSLTAGDKSHYWIWVGAPGHTLTANEIGGAASSIDGASISVGDWIIVAEIAPAANAPGVVGAAEGDYVVGSHTAPADGEIFVNTVAGTIEIAETDNQSDDKSAYLSALSSGDQLRVKEVNNPNWWDITLTAAPASANGITMLTGNIVVHGSAPGASTPLELRTVTPAVPDYQYRIVPGDLLSRNVARQMFSLRPWTPGAWPIDSVVSYDGGIYRATQGVTTSSPNPNPSGNPITIAVSATPGSALDGTAGAVLPTSPADGDMEIATAGGTIASGAFGTKTYALGDHFVYSADVNLTGAGTTTEGYPYEHGWINFGQTLPTPATATPPAQPTNPWQRVNVGDGLKTANADGDLPNVAPPNEVWLVLSSARAGGGAALYTYDPASTSWKPLSSGGVSVTISETAGGNPFGTTTPIGKWTLDLSGGGASGDGEVDLVAGRNTVLINQNDTNGTDHSAEIQAITAGARLVFFDHNDDGFIVDVLAPARDMAAQGQAGRYQITGQVNKTVGPALPDGSLMDLSIASGYTKGSEGDLFINEVDEVGWVSDGVHWDRLRITERPQIDESAVSGIGPDFSSRSPWVEADMVWLYDDTSAQNPAGTLASMRGRERDSFSKPFLAITDDGSGLRIRAYYHTRAGFLETPIAQTVTGLTVNDWAPFSNQFPNPGVTTPTVTTWIDHILPPTGPSLGANEMGLRLMDARTLQFQLEMGTQILKFDGASVTDTATGAPSPMTQLPPAFVSKLEAISGTALPKSGDMFINTADEKAWVFDGLAWRGISGHTDLSQLRPNVIVDHNPGITADHPEQTFPIAWTTPKHLQFRNSRTEHLHLEDLGPLVHYWYEGATERSEAVGDYTVSFGGVGSFPAHSSTLDYLLAAGEAAHPGQLAFRVRGPNNDLPEAIIGGVVIDDVMANAYAAPIHFKGTELPEPMDFSTSPPLRDDVFYNSADHKLWIHDGHHWQRVGVGGYEPIRDERTQLNTTGLSVDLHTHDHYRIFLQTQGAGIRIATDTGGGGLLHGKWLGGTNAAVAHQLDSQWFVLLRDADIVGSAAPKICTTEIVLHKVGDGSFRGTVTVITTSYVLQASITLTAATASLWLSAENAASSDSFFFVEGQY